MVRLQRAVEMSRFGNWKNSGMVQPYDNTIIITINRECYDIKRHVGILYIFFQPRALFQTSFVFER